MLLLLLSYKKYSRYFWACIGEGKYATKRGDRGERDTVQEEAVRHGGSDQTICAFCYEQ